MKRLQIIIVLQTIIITIFGKSPCINIEQGIIKGKTDVAANNRIFYSFTGIPYAKAPVGSLRFKPPVKPTPWKNVFNAKGQHPRCPQYLGVNLVGDEDCLYINVYTPQFPSNQKELLPVMFYIHGGGFVEGSGKKELWGPRYLLSKDIVHVSFNYRLGPFGFLTTGDSVLPGNLGLKDQAFALEWVKNNIQHFGGNPDKITVFGNSAGGLSAHAHMFSPLTKNKIKGVISQSGTILNPWGFLPLDIAINRTLVFADRVGCGHFKNSTSMVNCLRSKPVKDIMVATEPFLDSFTGSVFLFRPVVEYDCMGAFLCKHPVDLIKMGDVADVPFMTGISSEDGSILSGQILINTTLLNIYNQRFDDFVPYTLYFVDEMPLEEQKTLSKAIREFYLKNNLIGNSTITEFTNMFTDRVFLYPSQESATLHSKYQKQNAYQYIFASKGSASLGYYFYGPDHDFGVTHGDELLSLFNSEELFPNHTLTVEDKKISDNLVDLWTNFAYYGNPTPVDNSWKPFKENEKNYYIINNNCNGEIKKNLYEERIHFWRNMWKKNC